MKVFIPIFTPKFESQTLLYSVGQKGEDGRWTNPIVVEKAKSRAGNDYVRIVADIDYLETKIKETKEYTKKDNSKLIEDAF